MPRLRFLRPSTGLGLEKRGIHPPIWSFMGRFHCLRLFAWFLPTLISASLTAYKNLHLGANAPRWRPIMIEEHGILVGHWPAENIQSKIRQSGSASVHSAGPKAGIGRGQACSPLPFQSSCRSPRWIERLREYWQTASSSGPSQRVLCCAQRGCCSVPVCRLPDSVPGMSTAPADNGVPFQERILAPFWRSSHLPTPTERPEPVFPVLDASYIVVLASVP